MADAERIVFDFSEDAWLDTLDQLEDMLSSGHWSSRGLNFADKRTIGLFLGLLQSGGIAVYKRSYERRTDPSPELQRRAGTLRMLMGKRSPNRTLTDIAGIFSEYEYDPGQTVFNSLYYPELKTYVRCGGIPADRLLELLERDGCKMVLLFPDAHGEDYYYAFCLAMPREEFLAAIEESKAGWIAEMHEMLSKTESRVSYPVLRLPDEEDAK